MKYAVVNNTTAVVDNIILLEEDPNMADEPFAIEGATLINLDGKEGVNIGYSYIDEEFIAPPEPEPEPEVTIVPSVTLWERMTDQEAEQVESAMASQPFRTRQIFMTAKTFRSDHELWPLLETMATELFGSDRAVELLAAG